MYLFKLVQVIHFIVKELTLCYFHYETHPYLTKHFYESYDLGAQVIPIIDFTVALSIYI